MSKEAVRLEGITSESGCIPKGEFVRRVRGRENAELYRRSGLVISCEHDMRRDADFAVLVLML